MAKGKYQEWLEPDGLLKLEAWARDGLTDEQIAQNMGINTATLYRYKNDYDEICKALKRGKEVVDIEVENKLLKRALGYEYTEVTQERVIKKDNQGTPATDLHGFPIYEMVTTKTVKKEVLPDTTAQIFWLKNRRPDQWRDKVINENKTDININQKEDVKALAELILNPLPNRNRDDFE